jgi:hypothetical protein
LVAEADQEPERGIGNIDVGQLVLDSKPSA